MQAQGSVTNAKEDTVFYASGTITTDLSQFATDLTISGAGGYESASSRAAITSPREVAVRWEATAAEASVVLAAHGDNALSDETWQIATNGSGQIVVVQNGVTMIKGPVVAAADYTISWSTRANPDTTGASDAVISELVIYNHTAGALLGIAQADHAEATTSAAWTMSVGGRWDGATLKLQPTNAPTKIRVGRAWHPHVEALEDWVAARSAHVPDVEVLDEPLGPADKASQIGDSGLFAGSWTVAYAARHAAQLRRRQWTPLVNEVRSSAQTLDDTYAPVQWHLDAPNSSTYKIRITDLRWVRVPPGASHAYVRAHVKSWVVAGAAVPVGVRCYSLSRPPGEIDDEQGLTEVAFVGTVLTVDHGAAGVGEWLDLGLLPLRLHAGDSEDDQGTTYLALAYAIDPSAASANDVNARVQLRAWHARPTWVFSPPTLAIP